MKYDYLIVGAGFAGSVIAERIASQLNKKVLVVEKRNHIGGNAFDEYDKHGILVHKYGPHIFHTNSKKVFDYLSQFTKWRKYEHKVLAKLNDEYYPIPINRDTINKLYNKKFTTDKEVEDYYNKVKEKRNPILNSEDVIVNKVGKDLFEKFFRNYTKKQWNLDPKKLSPAVCGRIPVRTNTDDRYFTDKYQFMPKDGYTKLFENLLRHKNITLLLGIDYKAILDKYKYDKIIYTGPIDYFFDYKFGKLPYRSIRFEWKNYKKEYHQKVAVVNHVGDEKFTRVCEYKHLTRQGQITTTLSYEYSIKDGDPFYPIPTNTSSKLYLMYKNEAKKLKNVIFCGRLAEYKYYNMDQVIANSLKIFSKIISK